MCKGPLLCGIVSIGLGYHPKDLLAFSAKGLLEVLITLADLALLVLLLILFEFVAIISSNHLSINRHVIKLLPTR